VYAWVRRIPIGYSLSNAGVRRITDQIFIGCMHGSGDTDPISLCVCRGQGGILIQYSLRVFIGQADTDCIFIAIMQG